MKITLVTIAGSSSLAEVTVRQGPVDLAKLAITDLDGTAQPLAAASKLLPSGSVIRLHWEKAASPAAGSIAVTGHVLSSTDDQLELLLDGAPHDAVAWTNGDGEMAKAEAADLAALVEQHQWSGAAQSDAVSLADGATIRRTGPNDTDAKQDWSSGADDGNEGGGELPGSGASDLLLIALSGSVLLRCGWQRLRRFV